MGNAEKIIMNLKLLKNISEEKKLFYRFLCIHFLVWTCIGLIRAVLPADSLEGIYWGSLLDFGSPKHPPLAAWITYFSYLPFKCDFSIYFISQLFIVTGFIYTYRLAKFFLDENKAMLSIIILEGCWIYTYITGYYGFNPDVVLLCLLPVITFYFYKCMKYNNPPDWIKLGIIVGLSLLNKYQTILLIIGMAVWAGVFNPKTYKNKYFYIAVIIAFFIFLPHILWLIKYDFFPILYYDEELNKINGYNHLTAPLMFLGMQFVCIIGTLAVYCLFRFVKARTIEFIKDYDRKQFWFLLILTFLPCLIHTIIGIIYGSDIRPRWGYVFWYMLGIMLFYFFPCKIDNKDFKFILKSAYIVMLIIFLILGTLFTVEKNYRSRYPVAEVFEDIQTVWAENYNTPVKYIGGDSEWSFPITIYGEGHPINIMDTFGYKNPWIDEEDLKKSGAVFIDRNPYRLIKSVKKACGYLNEDFIISPVKYNFKIFNALNLSRDYYTYYFIVPPIK